jgi:hypothetical protein
MDEDLRKLDDERLTQSHSRPGNTVPTSGEIEAVRPDPNYGLLAMLFRSELLVRSSYHFKVTWPFCTRLVLNPMVGIELSRLVSGRPCGPVLRRERLTLP